MTPLAWERQFWRGLRSCGVFGELQEVVCFQDLKGKEGFVTGVALEESIREFVVDMVVHRAEVPGDLPAPKLYVVCTLDLTPKEN